jgi:uncharacterized membrane-anchored protein YitT (DUF2179 family)
MNVSNGSDMSNISDISKTKKRAVLKNLMGWFGFLLGSVCFAAGIALFFTPGEIAIGGFSGIALLINRFTGFPAGITLIIMNVPMVIICAKVFGFKFIIKSVAGVVVTSVLIDVFGNINLFNEIELSQEMYALFGGVIEGIGLGLLYMYGYTTGGSDLVVWLLRLKMPYVNMGTILFVLDAVIVGIGAIFAGSAQSILYSVIAIFCYTKAIDTVLGANNRLHLIFIISTKYEELADGIIKTMHRGVTVIDSKGWFTKESRPMIMCIIDRSQVYPFRLFLKEHDPEAFFILTDAREVIGQGFKDMNPANWNKKKEINIDKWNKSELIRKSSENLKNSKNLENSENLENEKIVLTNEDIEQFENRNRDKEK